MAPVFVLVISSILLRGIGRLGVERLASWREAGRLALVLMFLFTGATHFSDLQYDYAAMIPDPLPRGLWVVYLTGVLQIAGAIGLLIPACALSPAWSGGPEHRESEQVEGDSPVHLRFGCLCRLTIVRQ